MTLNDTGRNGASPDAHRPGFAALLNGEANDVLASAEFARAPVMSRLLRYLTEQTAAGDGERLKAYSIAIDALGRPDDFDAQHDSYVRVQMTWLRKALARHYASTTPRSGQCVYLQPGSYRLRIGRPEIAYPDIFRPAVAAVALAEPTSRIEHHRPVLRRALAPVAIVFAAIGLASVAVVGAVRYAERGAARAAAAAPLSPIMVIRFEGAPTTMPVGDRLSDALRRSWVLRLRTGNAGPTAARPSYALVAKVGGGGAGQQSLAVELTDIASGTLMWSRSIDLPHDASEIDDAIAPIVTRVAGATGLIASAEAQRLQASDAPGYACMLKYLEFGQTRAPVLQQRLDRCLAQPSPEPRMIAPLLAARSFFTLEAIRSSRPTVAELASRAQTAALLAQQAVEADPESAEAYYAVARIAYSRNDCAAGNRATERATANNRYQPMIGAVLSGLSYSCGYPGARQLLDRAIAAQDDGDQYLRGFLLFAAVAQGRMDDVASLGLPERPPPGPLLTRYLLLESIVAAAQDRRGDAARSWREFKQVYSGSRTSDEETLRHLVLSPRSRAQVLTLFRAKGVIPAA